ncbi:hypothetical protein K1I73_02505, partial [Streptococcus gordonii]|uniref:hypothetical protein n=1 Tax=Streptococcus gordonii TaxID=1302 RepID=UPI001CC0C462
LMMIFLPLTLLFSLFVTQGNKVFATEHGDVITRMYLTDSKGNELTSSDVDDDFSSPNSTIQFICYSRK